MSQYLLQLMKIFLVQDKYDVFIYNQFAKTLHLQTINGVQSHLAPNCETRV